MYNALQCLGGENYPFMLIMGEKQIDVFSFKKIRNIQYTLLISGGTFYNERMQINITPYLLFTS